MNTLNFEAALILELREDGGDIVATGYGMAVPYNVATKLGGVVESFARDAFTPEDVIGKPVA